MIERETKDEVVVVETNIAIIEILTKTGLKGVQEVGVGDIVAIEI